MRIAVDATFHAPGRGGGIETMLLGLLSAWARDPGGHEFVVFVSRAGAGTLPSGPGMEERVAGFPPGSRAARTLWQQAVLPRAARAAGARVLFAPANVGPARGLPLVVLVHDLSPFACPRMYAPLERAALGWFMMAAALRARRVLALTESVARELGDLFQVPRDRIRVISPGLDPAHTKAGRLAAGPLPRLPGLPRNFLLYAGTARENKNLPALLTAVALLKTAHGLDAPLVLAGRAGDRAAPLLARARELGIGAQVHFTGFVDRRTLAGLYGEARVLVVPSRYEGCGLPVLEAMAQGAPVACGRNLAETAGNAAELFDPSDPGDMARSLARVWTDEALRRDLAARGLARTRGLTWDAPAARALAAMEEAAG